MSTDSHVDVTKEPSPASRAHLATCVACRARYEAHTQLLRALAGEPSSPTRAEDEAVVRRVLAVTHASAVQTRAKPLARASLAPLVAAAACLAVFVVAQRAPPPPRTPRTPDAAAVAEPAVPVLAATIVRAKGATLAGVPAAAGARWLSGATLDVSAGGLVEVALVRGGTLRVFPGASLSLTPRGERVDLARGKVWAIVDAGRGRFDVVTEHASARVLGTSFLVEARPGNTDVKVVEGHVEVRGAQDTEPLVVAGGERTRVAAGHAEAARRYDVRGDSDEWQRFFDDLFRRIGKELQRGVDDVLKAFEPKKR